MISIGYINFSEVFNAIHLSMNIVYVWAEASRKKFVNLGSACPG